MDRAMVGMIQAFIERLLMSKYIDSFFNTMLHS